MFFAYFFFFFGQIVFIPTYLITTKTAFKPQMRLPAAIGYTLISPAVVYISTILLYGKLSSLLPSGNFFSRTSYYAELAALLLSFLCSFVYAMTGGREERILMFYVHNTFYMIEMVFNMIYSSPISVLIFSILVPCVTSCLLYFYFTIPMGQIARAKHLFHRPMLLLPIAAEILLVMRIVLSIFSLRDPLLLKYENFFFGYITLFGYVVLFLILLCMSAIAKDFHQIETISLQKEHLSEANVQIQKMGLDTLKALVATIDAKDEYTNGHSARVAEYALMIAERLNYSDMELHQVYSCALLHDIGKLAVPDELIRKKGSLTPEEYALFKDHPQKGAEILGTIEEIPSLPLGALYHHERWDGTGYPKGIAGEEIPRIARIIAVADAYDAMTSRRSYLTGMDQNAVRQEIQNGSGTQFDPEIARIMLNLINADVGFRMRQV